MIQIKGGNCLEERDLEKMLVVLQPYYSLK